MAAEILAEFEKQFPNGPRIGIEPLRIAADRASITVLFGASGSGKTTVLRCLAGLESPDSGRIQFGDEVWFDHQQKIFQSPQERNIGYLSQHYALFPHLDVRRNVGFGLRGYESAEREKRVAEAIDLFGLIGLERRLIRQLSGGQQQRVALARSVVRKPRLLLLDEPLAALDVPTRLRLRGELRQWLNRLGMPTILVTHDRNEALALGDTMLVMDGGRSVQQGPVYEVFSRPANLAVAGIVAVETVQPGIVLEPGELATVSVGNRKLLALATDLPPDTTEVYICIRGEDVILMKGAPVQSSPRNCLPAVVRGMSREGPMVRINLDCGFPLMALLTKQACEELDLAENAEVLALIKAPQIHLIPRSQSKVSNWPG